MPKRIQRCVYNQNNSRDLIVPHGHTALWLVGQWSQKCSMDICATETRIVKCNDQNFICDLNRKPSSERKCALYSFVKCGTWKYGSWSKVIIKIIV
jgi:hypothetical protein